MKILKKGNDVLQYIPNRLNLKYLDMELLLGISVNGIYLTQITSLKVLVGFCYINQCHYHISNPCTYNLCRSLLLEGSLNSIFTLTTGYN